MTTCPYCHGPVDAQVEAEGRCAVCGRSLLEPGVPGPTSPDEVETLRATLFQVVRRGPELSELIGETPPAPSDEASPPPTAETVADPPAPADDELRTLVSGSLPIPPEALQKTLDSGSFAPQPVDELRTLASGSLPPVPPTEGDDDDAQRTLDSGSVPKLSAEQIQATIDSQSGISPAQAARVSAIWALSQTPAGNPLKTIKASDAAYANKSTLVIKTRAFRRAQDVETGGADYELLELLGKGGMGVVYAARQASIDREVAVKMLNADNASDVMQRFKFLSEAVVTGELDHPNIVPIHDLGANEAGALFYSMKRVRGTPWMEALGKKSRAENLDILMKVADAVAFAHSRGVIHRDLKPENVMLGGFGEVLVMDWGLALSTPDFRKSSSITQSNSMGGTPAYMAPEMATGPIEKVGAASDVYLLGACLFEVIAGKPPHTGSNVMNCLYAAACNKIVDVEQNGELMDVARKAMATEPGERYASVQEFQAAIREYQSHSESILLSSRAEQDLEKARETDLYQDFARVVFAYEEALALWPGNSSAASGLPLARWAYAASALNKGDYDLGLSLLDEQNPEHRVLREELLDAQQERESRQQRLQRLRKTAGVMTGVFVVAITIALGVMGVLFNDARAQRKKAEDSAELADLQRKRAEDSAKLAIQAQQSESYRSYIAKIGLAAAQIDSNSFEQARATLDACPTDLRCWAWGRLNYLCNQGRFALRDEGRLEALAIAPDNQTLATATSNGQIAFWDVASHTSRGEPWKHAGKLHELLFSPDGRWLITAGGDPGKQIKLWDRNSAQPALELACGQGAAYCVALSRDGRWLAAGTSSGHVFLWELNTTEAKPTAKLVGQPRAHETPIWSLCFAPRKRVLGAAESLDLVVAGSDDGTVSVIDFSRPELAWPFPTFRRHDGPVYAVASAPQSGLVASAGDDGRIFLWDPSAARVPDVQAAVAGATSEPTPAIELAGHEAEVHSLAFSADGRRLASAGHDNAVRLWDLERKGRVGVLRGHGGWVRSGQFFADGNRLASCGYDGQALCWNLDDYRESVPLMRSEGAAPVLSVGFNDDGTQAVTAHSDGVTMTWNTRTGQPLATLSEGHDFLGESALFVPGGRRVLTGARDSTLRLWNLEAGNELRPLGDPLHYSKNVGQSLALAISPDGRWIAAGGDDNAVLVWHADSLAQRRVFHGHAEQVSAVAFSPDSRWILSGDVFGRARLWDLESGALRAKLDGHTRPIVAAAILPGGHVALTASGDGSVAQWDLRSGREFKERMLRHPGKLQGLSLSADGRRALTGCDDGQVRLWNVDTAKLERSLAGAFENLTCVALSADGKLAATVESRTDRAPVRLWDVTSGQELARPADAEAPDYGRAWSATFSPDGQRLLTIGARQTRLWDLASGRMLMSYRPHSAVASAQFSRTDARQVVTASVDRSAKLWNTRSALAEGGKLLGPHSARLTYAEYSPDGTRIVTCDALGKVVIWDVESRRPLVEQQAHRQAVNRAVYSTDGDRLLTVSADATAQIWKVGDKALEPLVTLQGHSLPVLAGAFSRKGDLVVTCGEDNSARVWDAKTGAELSRLLGHTAAVTAAVFSDDARRVLTGSQDNTAKLWELGQEKGVEGRKQADAASAEPLHGSELLTLSGHAQGVTSVAFSSDDRLALTGSLDGTAIVWPAEAWAAAPQPGSVARRP